MNIALHRRVLFSLLQKIYTDARLAPLLGFKGGTSLYFLHGLPRFSTDLDFNIIGDPHAFHPKDLALILQTELVPDDVHEKESTWLWNGVYEPGQWNLKVEISKRQFPDVYERKELFGLPMHVLAPDCQLSHKLCAITDRSIMVARDIFDVHFLLQKHVSIREEIISVRTGKSAAEYLRTLLAFIPKNIGSRGILDGLGELIHPEMKQRVKKTLLQETLSLLKMRLAEYEHAMGT